MTLPTFCGSDCGGNCCPLAVELADGTPVRVLRNPAAPPWLSGCRRGLDLVRFHASPDRLLSPLIRAGDRGSGEFREASWDEALDLVAKRLTDIRARRGAAAVLNLSSSGSTGALHDTQALATRFLNASGGGTMLSGNYSNAAARFSLPYVLGPDGARHSGFDPATLRHSAFIVLWGANILESRLGTELPYRLLEAKRRGARIVSIDPRYTTTAERSGARWIPIRPGTDSSLMLALLHVLLAENLADRNFARLRSVGFDELEDYVLGRSGGEPRDPEWASRICGVPPEDIRRLAREYAAAKPALLLPGYSIQRVRGGEDTFRLTIALQLATGNFGRLGGSTGSLNNRLPFPRVGTLETLPRPENPAVPVLRWPDAILAGRSGGYPSDIRAAYVCGCNFLNQGGDLGKGVRALRSLEFSVCHEMFLTPTARYCDVVLPAASPLEKEDIGIPWAGNFLAYKAAASPPRGKARSDYDIFSELSERMGFGQTFSEGRTARRWLDAFLADSEIPDIDAFRGTGIYLAPEQERAGLEDFARDPAAHPLGTPSGLVELSSAAYERDTGFPRIPVWRGGNPDSRYPLLLVTPKSPERTHSRGGDSATMKERGGATIVLHPEDAEERGVSAGDLVRAWNDRGEMIARAELSDRMIRGVACLYEGIWMEPGADGRPGGAAANLLTDTEGSAPSTACVMHGIPIEVERA